MNDIHAFTEPILLHYIPPTQSSSHSFTLAVNSAGSSHSTIQFPSITSYRIDLSSVFRGTLTYVHFMSPCCIVNGDTVNMLWRWTRGSNNRGLTICYNFSFFLFHSFTVFQYFLFSSCAYNGVRILLVLYTFSVKHFPVFSFFFFNIIFSNKNIKVYTYDKFNIRYYMALIVRDECRKDVNVNGFPKHDRRHSHIIHILYSPSHANISLCAHGCMLWCVCVSIMIAKQMNWLLFVMYIHSCI